MKSMKRLMALMASAALVTGAALTAQAEESVYKPWDSLMDFDVDYYAEHNPDVVALYGTDINALLDHYLSYGRLEGRLPYEGAIFTPPSVSEADVQQALYSLKSVYPEGMKWNDDDVYTWNGVPGMEGSGCVGFAYMLSDAVFGTAPADVHYRFPSIRVGDVIRFPEHTVIILEVHPDGYIVAEGNYNNSVHWGRKIPRSEFEEDASIYSRY